MGADEMAVARSGRARAQVEDPYRKRERADLRSLVVLPKPLPASRERCGESQEVRVSVESTGCLLSGGNSSGCHLDASQPSNARITVPGEHASESVFPGTYGIL